MPSKGTYKLINGEWTKVDKEELTDKKIEKIVSKIKSVKADVSEKIEYLRNKCWYG